jgi:hypothetical protein
MGDTARIAARTLARLTTPDLMLLTPAAHAKQREIIESRAKRKVICAGRRGGKTVMVAIVAAKALAAGERVLMAAPTEDQTGAFWENIKRIVQPLIDNKTVRKTEVPRLLEHRNGGRIRAKTAWNADTLRGDYADKLILDEYAYMSPDAWDLVGQPMLLDNGGSAMFISTPLRRNHFHKLYVRALGSDPAMWQAWHFTSHDNPHLSRAALADLAADMSEDAYRQEIMAEFLENTGSVFRNIEQCLLPGSVMPEDVTAHTVVIGVDWGKSEDFTVFSVFDVTARCELELVRFKGVPYIEARKRLMELRRKWGASLILAESNSIGEPIIEELQQSGEPVKPFLTTATSKPPLIELLVLAFERLEAKWCSVPVATAELESFERRVSATTGRSQYSAPDGLHDDTVMARALSWWAASQRLSLGVVGMDMNW